MNRPQTREQTRPQIKLPALHAGQLQVWREAAPRTVICAGRRFGKNVLSTNKALAVAQPGGRVWFVASDFPQAEAQWRLLRTLASQLPDTTIREVDNTVQFQSGGFIAIKSQNQQLRGEGLDLVICDEFAHWTTPGDTWNEALAPCLIDRNGSAWFISTPNGRNTFWEFYNRGLDPLQSRWKSFHFTSYDNPLLSRDSIEEMARDMPENARRQEIYAEFLDDGGLVFRHVKTLSILSAEKGATAHHIYAMGIDWGRLHDFTVLSIIDMTTGRQVYLDRFSGISWQLQHSRLRNAVWRFRPRYILAEENAIGQAQIEALQTAGLPVKGFITSAASKATIIEGLALALERQASEQPDGLTLLNDPVQIAELEQFTYTRTANGAYRYGAPEGDQYHDDTVIALALAWHAGQARQPLTVSVRSYTGR